MLYGSLTPLLEQHFSAGRRFPPLTACKHIWIGTLSPGGLWADWQHCDSTVISLGLNSHNGTEYQLMPADNLASRVQAATLYY